MLSENLSAAAIGGLASALRYHKQGWVVFLQVFITGTFFSYYATQDIVNAIHVYLGIAVSVGVMYFLDGYFASEILGKIRSIIRAFQVSKKWKS